MNEKYTQIIQSDTPTLVDFYADWCGPCKVQSPILDELKKKWGEKIRILKINIDKNQKLSQVLNVRGVPTLILYQSGKILWRESGVQNINTLVQLLQKYTEPE